MRASVLHTGAASSLICDGMPSISEWDVDIAASGKILTGTGDDNTLASVPTAVAKAGFVAMGDA